jgi:uncharacterized membrane protein
LTGNGRQVSTGAAMPTLKDVNAIHGHGLLPGARYFAAASAVRDDAAWATWAGRAILAIGAGHLLAGIVSFFAYNWADMSAVAKFATVEAALVIALAGAWFAGITRPLGQMSLIAASILVGVLLAVIGQVYNTDADAYTLFAAWTVLILPWTLASRSAVHWALWLIVLSLALSLYREQVLIPAGRLTESALEVGLGVLAAFVLALREVVVRKGMAWLAAGWTRITLLIATLGLLFWPAAAYVLDWEGEFYAPVAFVIALALAAVAYRRWLPDFAASTAVIGFAALFAIALGYRAIEDTVGFAWDDDARLVTSVGLLVLWSAAAMGLAAKLLQTLRRGLEPRPS